MSPCSSDYIFTDLVVSVWRVVSEDSDDLSTWLAVIHGLGDLDDSDQPTRCEMRTRLDEPQTIRKLQEVALLGSSKRILLEERDNLLSQVNPLPNSESMHVFFVVVISLVDVDLTHTEEPPEHVKARDALRTLCHRKLMRHLETSSIAPSIVPMRLTDEVDRKTTFSIHETSYPTNLNQSFLLIFRS